jgi:putative hemolysin
MRPALFVPENKSLHDLRREMRQARTQLAVVQDEFGGTAGIVTIEDIVEELFGDIVDEYDVEDPEIVRDGDAFVVGGKTHVDDVNAALGSEFESEEFDTIGGYVFGLFGRQPKQEECMENGAWRFCVADTNGRRILKLRVEKLSEPEQQESLDLAE